MVSLLISRKERSFSAVRWCKHNDVYSQKLTNKTRVPPSLTNEQRYVLFFFNGWLKYELTGLETSFRKGCDRLADATEGWSKFQWHTGRPASSLWPADSPLQSTNCCIGSERNTKHLWHFMTVRNTRRRNKGPHSRDSSFPADGVFLVRVWHFISISHTWTMHHRCSDL